MIVGNPVKLILIKKTAIRQDEMCRYYGDNFMTVTTPDTAQGRKDLIKDIKETLHPTTKIILCADTEMFKTLCKVKKVSGLDGIPCDNEIGVPAFIIPNYLSTYYNPEQGIRLQFIMDKVNEYLNGTYQELGKDIIHNAKYITKFEELGILDELLNKEALTVDIETAPNGAFRLTPEEEKKFKSGTHHFANVLYTISFAWNEHEGVVIYVNEDPQIKKALRNFFTLYANKCIYHNAAFDITQIIYHCFMNSLEDYDNMLTGLHTMCKNIDDTYLIAYLCLNSCAKVSLGLKDLSHEYSGNYGVDVSDVSKLPLNEVMEYNLKDTLSTWYVYKKYRPMLKEENQEEIYRDLFLPTLKVLIETQLVGLRIYPDRLDKLSAEITNKYMDSYNKLLAHPLIEKVLDIKAEEDYKRWCAKAHKKVKTVDDFRKEEEFNPGSDVDLTILLYQLLKLPVIDLTEGGKPSCSSKVLKKLRDLTDNTAAQNILDNLLDYSEVGKIISSFIPSFQRTLKINGMKGYYGNFNLGGTISGRLSSSNPNLQQLPSTGSVYAKPVKQIFGAPKGYIFVGADQRSLEDRISALTTRDPNKLSVYTSGFDGHCLRAYFYFRNLMPDIHMAEEGTRVFKVTLDDGTVEYLTEEELHIKYGDDIDA